MEIVLILLFLSSQNAVFGGEVNSTETPNSNMAEKIEALEDDWNTKFEELNGRVDKLENRIGELEEENTDLKQTLEATKLEMNTLKEGLGELATMKWNRADKDTPLLLILDADICKYRGNLSIS